MGVTDDLDISGFWGGRETIWREGAAKHYVHAPICHQKALFKDSGTPGLALEPWDSALTVFHLHSWLLVQWQADRIFADH